MTKLTLKYVSIIFSIFVVSMLFDSVYIRNIAAILVMGLVLLLVNLVVRPLLLLLALPLNILTFGLFSFVVNALTIMLADGFVSGVNMGGFFNSLLVALLIVVFQNLLMDRASATKKRKY
jgi:putative membrane protein